MIKKSFITGLIVLLAVLPLYATHNRAGEITYRQISDLTYEVTLTTFTYTKSLADRPQLDIEWGDNTYTTVNRQSETSLPNYYKKNVYVSTHTYPGPGIYKIVMQDPNRNYGVINIPNSVNVVFSVHTTLIVNPAFGTNSTPVLLNPPYDKAALGHIFIHNPGAYDPDGDSLSYALTVCTKEDGKNITNYTLPEASDTIYVNPVTGDLVWDSPVKVGIYNVALEIQEWRNHIKIGVVERDMQIEVYDSDNNPPVTSPLLNFCVEAGDTIDFSVTATDVDNDVVTLKAASGIFSLAKCPASFTSEVSSAGYAKARLYWIPCFSAVRHQQYDIVVKSEDNNPEVGLVDIDNMSIKVLGPSPKLLTAMPQGNFVRLTWKDYGTTEITGFNIYRKENTNSFAPDSCTDGIPTASGFKKVGYIAGPAVTGYTDTNNGEGLHSGVEYAYRIVAVFSNGTESKPSNEITTALVSGVPLIRNVTVRSTDETNGSIKLVWHKPSNLDTIPANGPYEYLIYRANGVTGSDYSLIKSISTSDLNDTVYVDTLINTSVRGYLYKIELYNRTSGNEFLIGEPGIASSLFMTASPGDQKVRFTLSRNVPWINNRYDYYRYNGTSGLWDMVGSSDQLTWTDTGLTNGTNYCYYAVSEGAYSGIGTPKNLINLSQRACTTPVDNEAPCTPVLSVTSQCDSLYNTLRWSVNDTACYNDISGYNLYFKLTTESSLALLARIEDKSVMKYIHQRPDYVAGCYAISAFDAHGNESPLSTTTCIDSCNFYEIPNVFTPNNDGFNDFLVAKTSGLVDKVDFKLFNRGGLLVFSTQEPKLNWDGTYKGKIVAPGVYYYECEVYETRVGGIEHYRLSGFVHVITEKGAGPATIETK
ncbi:MAG TPA: gliding motility-associated C-terminal domain-containing protein [Bacteroidales bacterium]|nr:gliding motility-associated C-terminal domain-containing protein [Bacteroidales bacterium]